MGQADANRVGGPITDASTLGSWPEGVGQAARPRSSRRWHPGTARSGCRGDTVHMLSDDSRDKHHDCSATAVVTPINDTRRADLPWDS